MKVKFLPQDVSYKIESGQSIMDLARKNKLPVSSSCNGMCSCAECRVYIVEGEAHLLPPSAKEEELIGGGHFIDNRRLSCQLFCFGDVTVDLSEQVERQKQGGVIKKQFLKQMSKTDTVESSSVGGIMVEQDKEMQNIQVSEEDEKLSSSHVEAGDSRREADGGGFYRKHRRERRHPRKKKWKGGGQRRQKPYRP